MTFPAQVYLDGSRVRCETCTKVVFPSEAEAKKRAFEITVAREPMLAYYSRRCGHWHLSRDKEEGRRREDMARKRRCDPDAISAAMEEEYLRQTELPECCTAHIKGYVDIDPVEYPRDRAALCCRVCFARLVYTKDTDTWSREAQEDMVIDPLAVRSEREVAVRKLAPKAKQRVDPLQGSLLDQLRRH